MAAKRSPRKAGSAKKQAGRNGSSPAVVDRLPLAMFAEQAYLDYSMYVVLDRALPTLGDGLKPVQRRIVYAMSELGLAAGAKPKKSARTIGDVIGKYHPHGDTACYEAMVLMAQPFSYRYPLIHGQGNWGSVDNPKSFAAMRYTEASLSTYAKVLTQELDQGAVDWRLNFDGTLREPIQFPARLPNLLLNGSSGIAVGMSIDIPPHNLNEIVAACVRLLDAPGTSLADLLKLVRGPDFPGGGQIVSGSEEISQAYQQGVGAIRVRASYAIERGEIVISSLPYQVPAVRILEQIAAQVREKKLLMVEDLRDESDQESPVRLVIVPRGKRVDAERLMSHLFATTDLEHNCRINFNVIGNDGKPQVRALDAILREWIAFRKATLRRRLEWKLEKLSRRIEQLDGLMIAYLNLEEVIAIIRRDKDPQVSLVRRFRLSETQAQAILDVRLRHLSQLEEARIAKERKSLAQEQEKIGKCLDSPRRLKTLVKKELLEIAGICGDKRRTTIATCPPAVALEQEQLAPVEELSVVLSRMGWVRIVRGHDVDVGALEYRTKDAFLDVAHGNSRRACMFLDARGRCYTLPAKKLPSFRSRGEPLSSYFSLRENTNFVSVVCGSDDELCLFASDHGYALLARLGSSLSQMRAGKQVLNVAEDARAIAAVAAGGSDTGFAAAVGSEGHLLLVPLHEIPVLSRGKGVKLLSLGRKKPDSVQEHLVAIACVQAGQILTVHAGKRVKHMRPEEWQLYQGGRGRRGRKLPKGYRGVSRMEVSNVSC